MGIIHLLHLEKNAEDAELIHGFLKKSGLSIHVTTAENYAAYASALEEQSYDIILSDYPLIDADMQSVLRLSQQKQSNTPFILISQHIDDETAMGIIKSGAMDCLLKDNLIRLPGLIERALKETLMKVEHAEQKIIQNEILSLSKTAFFKLDDQGSIVYYNKYFQTITQLTDQQIFHRNFLGICHPTQCSEIFRFFSENNAEISLECRLSSKKITWVKLHIARQIHQKNNTPHYIGSMIDITALKKTEIALENTVLELKLIHEITTLVSHSKWINTALQRCINLICKTIQWPIGHAYVPDYKKNVLIPTKIWYFDDFEGAQSFMEYTENLSFKKGVGLPGTVWDTQEPYWIEDIEKNEFFLRKKSHIHLGIQSTTAFPILSDGKVIAILEFFSTKRRKKEKNLLRIFSILGKQMGHVLERKIIEKKLEHLAHYDTTTQLPNRTFFHSMLEITLEKATKQHHAFALIYIDIDNFKFINDSHGHHVGDEFLVKMAEKIKNSTRECDFIARMGGDEFVVIIDPLETESFAEEIVHRLIKTCRTSFLVNEIEISASISIGVAIYPTAGKTEAELLSHADTAMYQAKKMGKNTYQFYTRELNEMNKRRLLIEDHLSHAIKNNEFSLLYQPQISLPTQEMYGMEALLRWHSEAVGEISPEEFIPIAESMGLIYEIGTWVFDTAIEQFHQWLTKQPNSLHLMLHVNCSALQLQNQRFVEFIRSKSILTRFPKKSIILELTETLLMQNIDGVDSLLEELEELGVKFAIDDFGTGYSSLNYIKKLPISILKIDKSFIQEIPHNENDVAIVKAIIQLGKTLDLHVVAEGVETIEQHNLLLEMNCPYAQGYFYARPLPPEKISEMLGRV